MMILLLLFQIALAIPTITSTKLDSFPSKLIYFDDQTLLVQEGNRVWRSADQGKSYKQLNIPITANVVIQHPYDSKKAYILTQKEHFWTEDQGANWNKFITDLPVSSKGINTLSFHPNDVNKIIIHLNNCSKDCRDDAFYTIDSFKTIKPLLSWTTYCVWAQAINKNIENIDHKIFCLEWPAKDQKGDVTWKDPQSLQLVSSINYFEKEKQLVTVGGGVPVLGITPFWLVGIVRAEQGGYRLISTKDGSTFLPSTFSNQQGDKNDHKQSLAFSILESSNASLFVDVISSMPGSQLPMPFGTLYVSNSNGEYFVQSLEHTNRDLSTGMVDFEHIQSTMYEGVLLGNTVKNWKDILDRKTVLKELTSFMSFDNGRKWGLIQPPQKDSQGKDFACTAQIPATPECSLHLHSVTTSRNVGRVFSVSSAPGIIVGVGSVGPKLNPYEQSDTFLSQDSGKTWKQVEKGPHKFEILNFGSTIVLVPDSSTPSNYVLYSKNRGTSWEKLDVLLDGGAWMPMFTTLDVNSTSSSLILAAAKQNMIGQKYLVHLDFASLYSRVCSSELSSSNKDLELWKLETPDNRCVLGTSVGHYRRKADADCSMDRKFGNGLVVNGPCPCTEFDYECDAGFALDQSKPGVHCVALGQVKDQPIDCKPGDKYQGLSGYRVIPGNQCKGGEDKKANRVEKECKEGSSKPPSEPISKLSTFQDHIVEIVQIPNSEVSFMLNREGFVWKSMDQGASWKKIDIPQKIVRIVTHETKKGRIFLFSLEKIYVSDDGLEKPDLVEIKTPEPYNSFGIPIIDFHPKNADWYTLVTGGRDCSTNKSCHSKAYITKDNGKTFTLIETWATKCIWVMDVKFTVKEYPEDAIFCSSFKIKDGKVGQDKAVPTKENPVQLVLITQEGKSMVPLLDLNVLDFYIVGDILLVATNEVSDPVLLSSIDGQQFKKVSFPPLIKLEKDAFTLLKSNSGGIYLDIAQNVGQGSEFGMLFKSNENGLFFSRVLANTNRGSRNQVDFQKFPGLEGVAIANTVANTGSIGTGIPKQVVSVISYDDGSTWSSIPAPKVDLFNNPIDCTGKCSLHLHIEVDAGIQGMLTPFGTEGSAGLLLAVGNIGESLLEYTAGNVYMTRDGGLTWTEIRKEAHMWAIADYGGLVVLVNNEEPTDHVSYSWDFGKSWADHKFTDHPLRVESIVSHEGSNKILLTGHGRAEDKVETVSVHIDFGSLFTRKCDRSKTGGGKNDDFEEWSPQHDNGCFFGQKASYVRRLASSICFVGQEFKALKPTTQSCECTKRDFECDYNFFRNDAGECVLYGLDPEQPTDCISGTKYKGSSGYRKISLSKCSGGKDLALPIDRECGEQSGPENVKLSTFYFDSPIDDFFYFKSSATIIVKDNAHQAYISTDEGHAWKKIVVDEKETINAIIQDPYHSGRAFVVTSSSSLWVTGDVGKSFQKVKTIGPPDVTLTPNFVVTHPNNANWIIWIAAQDCDNFNPKCHTIAQVSWDSGNNWSDLTTYAQSCIWATTPFFKSVSEKTIFCSVYTPQSGNQRSLLRMSLMRSDYGDSKFVSLFDTNGFAIENEYLVSAVPKQDSKEVSIYVSLDGVRFATADFGASYPVHEGYTVLESNTGNIFLHMIRSNSIGAEYGALFKSNWNGTHYQKLLDGVNQNRNGFVDFEKVAGINGTIAVNEIANLDALPQGDPKRLITKFTFNDGDSWVRIPAPATDSHGKSYNCGDSCNLNLHAFTERHDRRDSYSSIGSVGLLLGVGNVGESLTDFTNGDVFRSIDAGRSWKEIAKEAHMIEIADHGAVIVMVNDEEPVSSIKYSLDYGNMFRDYPIDADLHGGKIRIQNIITEPSGTTSHFVLFGRLRNSVNDTTVAIHLDFSKVWSRMCKVENEDFERWSPSNLTLSSTCVFGERVEFMRRKQERECFIGDTYKELEVVRTPCECSEADFECDQYHTKEGSKCVPIPNLQIPEPKCINGIVARPTGYVKKKISMCKGGLELHIDPHAKRCSTGSISWGIFFLITLPLTAGALYMFYLYQKGGLGRYGHIALPLDDYGRPRSFLQRFWMFTSSFASEVGENLYSGIVFSWNWIQERIRGNSGYTPVSTHYYDADLPTNSATALELNWDDEE